MIVMIKIKRIKKKKNNNKEKKIIKSNKSSKLLQVWKIKNLKVAAIFQ